jgi:chromosome segregation ATPase
MRVFLLAAIAAAQDAVNLAVQASSNANRPVAKVINLLNEMAAQVTKEKNSDEELHEKMDCWCKTNTAEKTAAIADAERRSGELQSTIEENVALEAQLQTEIANLATEIDNKQKSLAQATEMRAKENAEFEATHAETVATLKALSNAINALQKHHGDNGETFVQVKNSLVSRLPNTAFAQKMQQDLWAVLGSAQEKQKAKKLTPAELLETIFAAPQKDGFLQQPTGAAAGVKSYNSRSGEIFGILNQMHDDFTRDDKEAVEAEQNAVAAFQKLSTALNDGISSATESKKAKEVGLAQA